MEDGILNCVCALCSNVPGIDDVKKDIVILGIQDTNVSIFDFLCSQLPSEYPEVGSMLAALADVDKGKFFNVGKDM